MERLNALNEHYSARGQSSPIVVSAILHHCLETRLAA
jgi:hypothetical protein